MNISQFIDSGVYYLNLKQILKLLGISKTTWYKLINQGIAKEGKKIGRAVRYPIKDIEELIEKIDNFGI